MKPLGNVLALDRRMAQVEAVGGGVMRARRGGDHSIGVLLKKKLSNVLGLDACFQRMRYK